MEKVSITLVKKGMTIAEDIKDNIGNLLYNKGTELDVHIIQSLVESGIQEVFVYEGINTINESLAKLMKSYNVTTIHELKQKINDKIEQDFKENNKQPIIVELTRLSKKFIFKRYGIE